MILPLQVGVIKAVRSKRSYKKVGGYIEVILNDSDDYATTIAKTSTALRAQSGDCYLIRSNGCKILDQPFPGTDGEPWSIGRYMKESSHGRNQIKLGLVVEDVS